MATEVFDSILNVWIPQYGAMISLVSILAWMAWARRNDPNWEQVRRDCTKYIVTITVPALVVILVHQLPADILDSPFIASLTWFCTALLLIIELLWLSFLFDRFVAMLNRNQQGTPAHVNHPSTLNHGQHTPLTPVNHPATFNYDQHTPLTLSNRPATLSYDQRTPLTQVQPPSSSDQEYRW